MLRGALKEPTTAAAVPRKLHLDGVLPLREVQQRVEEDHHREDQPELQRLNIHAGLVVNVAHYIYLHMEESDENRRGSTWRIDMAVGGETTM